MKQVWEIQTLGEVATFSQGIQVGLEKQETKPRDGYVRFIRIVDYTQNTNDIRYVKNPGEKYFVNEDDIVMVRYGTPGLIGRGKSGVIANNLFRIKIERQDLINDYLALYLSQENIQNYLSTQGSATMPALNFRQLKTVEVSFPSPTEQKLIVKILDKAFAAIAKAKSNAEQNIQNAKELYQSHFNKIITQSGEGWKETSIDEECKLMTGGTPSKNRKDYFENGKINWLVSGDIHKKPITECEGKITQLGLENSNAKYLPLNSVMIALNGQGKTRGTVTRLEIKATCNQSLVSIFPKNSEELLSEYIYVNLKSRYSEIRKMTGDSGNDRRGLNMSLISSIKFIFPKDIVLQRKIIDLENQLSTNTDKLIGIYQKKIESLEELKKSVLQKAFNGELKTTKAVAV